MLKKVLFDHDDLDAAGCRILFSIANWNLKVPTDYIIVNCSNNNVDKLVQETTSINAVTADTEIWFSDICPSREVLEDIVSRFKTVKILDHHRTNFYATWVLPTAVIVPENALGMLESGTSLMFQHFTKEAIDNPGNEDLKFFRSDSGCGNFTLLAELSDTIRSYDTYEWKETNNIAAKQLQTLFFLLGMDRFCKRYVDRVMKGTLPNLIGDNDMDFVESKLEYEQKIIDSVGVDDIYDVSIRGLRAAFILSSAGANISEISHQFLNKHKEFDMFIGFSFAKGGEYSFRCIRDDLDIGADIASVIGGGGHPKASGAPIPEEIRDQIIDLLMKGIDPEFHR